MTPSECMRLLEVAEPATVEQIKRAYHQLAYRLHPDHNGGDLRAQRRFISISEAYHSLMQSAHAVERGKKVAVCARCGEFDEAIIGLDGRPRCPRCIFRPDGGRLLPMPALVVVKCVSTLVLIGLAIYLLAAAVISAHPATATAYALCAIAAGLLSLVTLAYTCLRVLYCISNRERFLQRSYHDAESQAKACAEILANEQH